MAVLYAVSVRNMWKYMRDPVNGALIYGRIQSKDSRVDSCDKYVLFPDAALRSLGV